ncbi:hypothetical protein PU634_08245 [Oceanimonas pelagia]|uniref:Uncharacterized protein n=1 Tax=Oceanimonas pelagia TaxID=3028314 RepID=A0AA50Q8U7_9GAMM|nr:hypothetical protein [Oceanimonas pelagia]WMC12340.1 hypothetical protein PU634_08245 [Oceanimonas pelagia]
MMRSLFGTSALAAVVAVGVGLAQPAQAVQVVKNLDLPATMKMDIEGDCDNRGSRVVLGPTLELNSIPVTVFFDGGGQHDYETDEYKVDLILDLNGVIDLPKQGADENGVTGNPKISVWMNGNLLFGPVRCNKL